MPEEVALVREAIDRLFAGESLRGICFDWGARGIKTADGNAWRAHLLSRYLSSPTISAERENEGTLVPGKWPGVITAEEGLRVRTFLHPQATPRQDRASSPGNTFDKSGYALVRAPRHPHCNIGGYIREHRLVMEQVIGRYLLPNEVVTHLDGNKANNRPANLKLYASNSAHKVDQLRGNSHALGDTGNPRRSHRTMRGPDEILDALRRYTS